MKAPVLSAVVILHVLLGVQSPPPIFAAQQDSSERESHDSLATARRRMIDRDLRGRGIKDSRVLAAMEAVPRHLFVAENLRASAYDDRPLPIGVGQTISQPYVVAYMSELLELRGNEKALEIGTGSGYQAAVLAQLAAEVYSIEIIPSLSESAKRVLDRLGFRNVYLKVGDGFFGWDEKAQLLAFNEFWHAPARFEGSHIAGGHFRIKEKRMATWPEAGNAKRIKGIQDNLTRGK